MRVIFALIALALAANALNTKAYIVMPTNAPSVKREAVAGYGAQIIDCEPTLKSRESIMEANRKKKGATFIHPSNDMNVILGNATAVMELAKQAEQLDVVIAPVGLTIWLIWTLMGWVDGFVLPLVPDRFNPEQYIGINLRGDTPVSRSFSMGMKNARNTPASVACTPDFSTEHNQDFFAIPEINFTRDFAEDIKRGTLQRSRSLDEDIWENGLRGFYLLVAGTLVWGFGDLVACLF